MHTAELQADLQLHTFVQRSNFMIGKIYNDSTEKFRDGARIQTPTIVSISIIDDKVYANAENDTYLLLKVKPEQGRAFAKDSHIPLVEVTDE